MWVRIIDQGGVLTVAEVVSTDPATIFTGEIAALFVLAGPGMIYRAQLIDGEWVAPSEAPPPAPAFLRQISPVAFLLLFEPAERVAIRVLRKRADIDDDPLQQPAMIVDDWMRIVEDPRLQTVDLTLPQAQAGIDFLVTLDILTPERAAEIKQGVPL